MTNTYYIGLDVHKETIAIAYANGGTREESVYHGPCGGSVPAAVKALRKLAEKLGVEFSALKVCKGFQEVAAMTVISELGDLRRFSHPRALMGFLGLVPGEDSTGSKRRQGSITKCGN